MPDPLANVRVPADWSPWLPWRVAVAAAPSRPGVYVAREGEHGPVVYVGKAGERAASQPGPRGRLRVSALGKAAVSGLGKAALDRALADPAWLRDRAERAEQGRPARAKDWAHDAFDRLDLRVAWAETLTGADAVVGDPLARDRRAEPEPQLGVHARGAVGAA